VLDVTTADRGSAGAMTLQETFGWIAGIFEEAPERITEATRRGDLRAWDSLGQLILMSELDQRFGIRLTQEELSSLASVRDILDILARNQLLRGNPRG
jgi:acyl carrier protein